MRNVLAAALLLGAAASAALCDNDFQWQGKVDPGQQIQIRGVIGNIHAHGVSGDTAMVTAHKSGTNSDPAGVNIQVVQYDGGVVVCVMYPDGNGRPPNTCNPPGMDIFVSANNNDVQVDFDVQVPRGVKLAAITVDGDIQATSVTANVEAATNKGSITISTTGDAQASTLQGPITASIGSVKWTGAHAFHAGGDLDLEIPSNASVDVRAIAFGGNIISDFPLNVTHNANGGVSSANGTLGSGGRTLILRTFKGNITLRQGPTGGS